MFLLITNLPRSIGFVKKNICGVLSLKLLLAIQNWIIYNDIMKTSFDYRKFRKLCKVHGLTISGIAKQMEVARQTVQWWNKGAVCPNGMSLIRLAALLEVNPLELIKGRK